MSESEDFYVTASYDGIVRNVTLAIWILLIAESIFFVVIPISSLSMIVAVFILTLSLIVLLVPYLFKPKGFGIASKELTIKGLLNTISIPYSQISEIEKGKWTWKAVRLGGSGGLYGYLGMFHFFGVGRVWMYITNRNKMVLIETKSGKKSAISPENPEGFVFQLQKKVT